MMILISLILIINIFLSNGGSSTSRLLMSCGYTPSSCSTDITWATNDGRYAHPEWYPDFYESTGTQLSAASEEDMKVYWYCSDNLNCNGLTLPCGRSCGGNSNSNSNSNSGTYIADYLGFDLSVGLQSNPLSISKIADITSSLENVKNYRFYGYGNDDAIAREILDRSPFANDLKFTIEIIPNKVNSLSFGDIDSLLSTWDDMKGYIYCIQLGNEPLKNSITFSILSDKLQMVYNRLKQKSGWQNVVVSIPFSADIFDETYPVKDSTFKSQYKSELTQILRILQSNDAPFSINLYPFFTVMEHSDLLQYCLGNEGDSTGTYESMLAAQYDATLYALNDLISNNGVEVIITETGWATYGSSYSSISYANQYLSSLKNSMNNPSSKLYKVKIFLFELFDEERKGNNNEQWERNFGYYYSSGSNKFSNIF